MRRPPAFVAALSVLLGVSAWFGCGSSDRLTGGPDAGGGADASVDAPQDGTGSSSHLPDGGGTDGALPNPGPLRALAAGDGFACAVVASGDVYCWGRNDVGQLGHANVDSAGIPIDSPCGVGNIPCSATPGHVDGVSNVVALSTGTRSACALQVDGSVFCWGLNNGCALGHDTTQDFACGSGLPCNPKPLYVPGLPSAVIGVGVGHENACAAVADAGIYCWGAPLVGMDGNLAPPGDPNCSDNGTGTPELVAGTANASTYLDMPLIFQSRDSASCVAANGGAVCWGDDVAGQLGTQGVGDVADAGCGGLPPCSPAANIVVEEGGAPLANVAEVSTGYQFACARLTDGRVTCWGEDQTGTFATSDKRDVLTIGHVPPVAADRLAKVAGPVQLVRTGAQHVAALDVNGGLWLWGSTAGGAVAVDPANGPTVSVPTRVTLGGQAVVAVATGVGTTFAQTADGTLWAWGYNDTGELGHMPATEGDSTCDGAVATACTFTPVTIPWL